MAILKIAKMGHPVLKRRAEEVADPRAPEVARLIGHMNDTLNDAGGVGLAAPQVHVPWRVVLYEVPPERDSAEDGLAQGLPRSALINPVLEPLADDMEDGWEGCLSVPGLQGLVPRYTSIRYSGMDAEGQSVAGEAHGFHARVLQHECDHLDGVLYPMRMTDLSQLHFVTEMRHYTNEPPDPAAEPDDG